MFSTGAMAGKDLDAIKARGSLVCSVGTGTAGFMLQDSQGKWVGLDVDVCRRWQPPSSAMREGQGCRTDLAAAPHGAAVGRGRRPVQQHDRTLTRDTALGLDFAAVTYYDGQGYLVNKKLGMKSAKELNGATVCVAPGTTTELSLADYFRADEMTFKPVVIEKVEEVASPSTRAAPTSTPTTPRALSPGRPTCRSGKAEDLVVLPEIISKEPLAPAVRTATTSSPTSCAEPSTP